MTLGCNGRRPVKNAAESHLLFSSDLEAWVSVPPFARVCLPPNVVLLLAFPLFDALQWFTQPTPIVTCDKTRFESDSNHPWRWFKPFLQKSVLFTLREISFSAFQTGQKSDLGLQHEPGQIVHKVITTDYNVVVLVAWNSSQFYSD